MKDFLQIFNNIFKSSDFYQRLDEYISSKNPKGIDDVERFEREFYRTKQGFTSFDLYR